jgi:hypothetical protein
MNLLASAAIAAALVLTPAAAFAESQIIGAQPFTIIDVSSGIEAVIEAGGETSIMAEGSADALKELRTEFRDGTFRAWRDQNLLSIFDFTSRPIKLSIGVAQLDNLIASAGSSITVANWSGDALSAEASSGASIKAMEAVGKSYRLASSSGSRIEVGGECTSADADVSSGASIAAAPLKCADVKASASSGGSLEITASTWIDAEASSGASITIHGKPTVNQLESSSGGNVTIVE